MNKVKEGTIGDFFKTLFGSNDEYSLNPDGLNEEEIKELKEIKKFSKDVEIELIGKYSGELRSPKGGRKKSGAKEETTINNPRQVEEQYVRQEGRERE